MKFLLLFSLMASETSSCGEDNTEEATVLFLPRHSGGHAPDFLFSSAATEAK